MKHIYAQPALESIAFQSTVFRNALIALYTEMREVSAVDLPDHPLITETNKLIKKHTGLTMTLTINEFGPAVSFPTLNKNNVLVNNTMRNYVTSQDGIKMLDNAHSVVSGTVDLNRGMVSGVFSDVNYILYMPGEMILGTKYTPGECAAATLHEVGHILTFCEHFAMAATTNQALAGIARGLDGSDINKRQAVLESARKKFNLKDFDAKELAAQDDKVVEVAFISAMSEQSISLLGRSIYDYSSWEYLSDQYAARQGASRDLATALSKIYGARYNIAFRGTIAYVIVEALKLSLFLFLPVLVVMIMVLDGQGDGSYDMPGTRLKRIRNQVIEHQKDRGLTKAEIDALQDDLKAIDECLFQINDRRQFVGVLYDFFWPGASKDRKFTKLQKDLEDLAANELFSKSAQWRSIA